MTHPSDYAPQKQRINPADNIADLHPRPLWPRKPQVPAPPPAMFDTPAPTVEYEVEQPAVPTPEPPPTPRDPTDKEYVAINIDRLRHLDLKDTVNEMFGDEMPKDKAEIADKMATWAAANNPRAAA